MEMKSRNSSLDEWAAKGFPIPDQDFKYKGVDASGNPLRPILYKGLDLSLPWESFDIVHELTTKGIQKFVSDGRRSVLQRRTVTSASGTRLHSLTPFAQVHGFRAHGRDPLLLCEFYQRVQMLPEFRSLHVIGIASEARVAPTYIYRVVQRMSEAAQTGHIAVMDAGGM
jgi:hypothetical protein